MGFDLRQLKRLKGRLTFDVPMSRHTTMRVGGCAPAVYEPQSPEDLVEALKICRRNNISMQVIGKGSNIIVDDDGTKKIMLKLTSQYFKKIEIDGNHLTCGGGVSLNKLCDTAEANSMGGCEFLVGIPGTVGGAVVRNAGAHGSDMSDIVNEIRAIDDTGNTVYLNGRDAGFGYRKSSLKGLVVISVRFRLNNCDVDTIRSKISHNIERRLSVQDYTAPSAGCIFKNPLNSDLSAGELIDRCGLKGRSIGGAYISDKHANFIINRRSAKAKEVLQLIELMREKVKAKFGVELEEEVEIIR